MASRFGLENDDNLNLIKKVSQVMSTNVLNPPSLNTSKIRDKLNETQENNVSFFNAKTPNLLNLSKNETFFLKDLSKIEINPNESQALISTDRNEFLKQNDLMTLTGIIFCLKDYMYFDIH